MWEPNEGPDADRVCIFDKAPWHARIEEMDLNGVFQLHDSLSTAPFSQWLRMRFLIGKQP